MQTECRCSCGQVQFAIKGEPLFRAFCHCTICQSFNRSAHADILLVRTKDVALPPMDRITFKTHKQPPIVRRGQCSACGSPVMEALTIPAFPKLSILPVQTMTDTTGLPDGAFHMFYDRRVADIEDDLPKHAGYLPSQWAFGATLLKALVWTRQGSA